MNRKEHTFGDKPLSGVSLVPIESSFLYVFAHGAGVGMNHDGMTSLAESLYNVGIASFRFNFPYMEDGRKSPGSPKQAMVAIVQAMEYCRSQFPEHKLIAGGKSYGGRMTSTAASMGLLEHVYGLVFYGFPLHAPGKPSDTRAEHLYSVNIPMLFLQGTRDKLAELELLTPVINKIGADLEIFEGADHSFNVLKSNPLTKQEVINRLSVRVKDWLETIA